MSGSGRYIYGRHPVAEALRAHPREVTRVFVASAGRSTRLSDVVQRAERHRIAVVTVSKQRLDELVGEVPHQGVVAQVQAFRYADLEDLLDVARARGEPALVVALDLLQDPHNLGSVARSALALGAHGLVIPKDRSVEVTPTVVKAAAGATAHLKVARVTNLRRALETLKQEGLWVVGAVAEGGTQLGEVDLLVPTALVIGSEGKGLRRTVHEACDVHAHIPMGGDLGSLNASVAAGIFLYEVARQRTAAESPS